MAGAGVEFWDGFYRRRLEAGGDLDWTGLWTTPFLGALREAGARTVLELGCGTGNDAARLAEEGYSVTAVDLSGEAIGHARAKYGAPATFLVADITQRLPFPDASSTRSCPTWPCTRLWERSPCSVRSTSSECVRWALTDAVAIPAGDPRDATQAAAGQRTGRLAGSTSGSLPDSRMKPFIEAGLGLSGGSARRLF